ncbi:Threonine synthase-like 2 [Chelonia mydas]|uniref:Threonine synthase-like 2 n=1 Tax=Chelonia mydas TaxID=8469 RepID=M7BJH4_CHEMY|nr:Threonine synthase-like 2 [Chelonia mydas]
MRYVSTRGEVRSVDFEGALFSGYALDGGLFVPQEIPTLDYNTLRTWSAFPYPELVKELSSLFISSELIPRKELNDLTYSAFRRFRHNHVVHLARLKDGLNVLELWHGVTYAFKDLSLSCTGQFLQYFLKKRKQHITILVADGNSDEIDEPIKELVADADFARQHNLMSLNSINWSRIMVQIAHYFYAYFQCTPSMDMTPLPAVEIVVPTGGGGNITAEYIAQKMGLPIRLVAVVNKNNDSMHRAIQHGDFSFSGSVKPTLASAMDIQEPYNMERILWLLSDCDGSLIKTLMEQFYTSKHLTLSEEVQRKLSEALSSCSASDEDIVQAMRRCWEDNHYLLCPHSAVAVHYHYQQLDCHVSNRPRCCLAPASAAKFPDAVLRVKLVPEVPPDIQALKAMETRSTTLRREDDWAKTLRDRIEAIAMRRHT